MRDVSHCSFLISGSRRVVVNLKYVLTVFQQKKQNASEQRRCAGHVSPQGKESFPGDGIGPIKMEQNHRRAGRGCFLRPRAGSSGLAERWKGRDLFVFEVDAGETLF